MKVYGTTDAGRVRRNNQDTFICGEWDNGYIFVVCDGMGGAKAGNVASDVASQVFTSHIRENIRPVMSMRYMENILTNAVNFANYETYYKALSSREFTGMGTTLVGGFTNGEDFVLTNVGDSRCYVLEDDNFYKLTCDHSVVEEMYIRGEITAEEAKNHPHKNLITRALGTEEHVVADIYNFKLDSPKRILLCSDGLTNMLSDEDIKAVISGESGIEQRCGELVRLANEAGGNDNITVVLIDA